jgi:hypothetical protein
MWRTDASNISLAQIVQALATPTFVPYAGRKAHALMLPMSPRVPVAIEPHAFSSGAIACEVFGIRHLHRGH